MTKIIGARTLTALALTAAAFGAPAVANEGADLVVNGEIEMVITECAYAQAPIKSHENVWYNIPEPLLPTEKKRKYKQPVCRAEGSLYGLGWAESDWDEFCSKNVIDLGWVRFTDIARSIFKKHVPGIVKHVC